MVFLTLVRLFAKPPEIWRNTKGPDRFWKRRQIFRLTDHFSRRRRNCYSIAIRALHKAWEHSSKGGRARRMDMKDLRETRLDAACAELGTSCPVLLEGLARSNILLDRKVLVDLAIYEPRTFQSLTKVAMAKYSLNPPRKIGVVLEKMPDGVVTRGLL